MTVPILALVHSNATARASYYLILVLVVCSAAARVVVPRLMIFSKSCSRIANGKNVTLMVKSDSYTNIWPN